MLVVAFATLLTTHVTIAVGLARRARPGRALLALFVAPLAPWWGWKARMRMPPTYCASTRGASVISQVHEPLPTPETPQ